MTIRKLTLLFGLVTGGVVFSFACAGKKPRPLEPAVPVVGDAGADADAEPEVEQTLYERIGGKEKLAKVLDSFIANAQADAKVKRIFAKLSPERLDEMKSLMADQICVLAGGPCEYKGKDMKEAHAKLRIKEAEWDAFINDFTLALDEQEVGEDEKNELIVLLAPMKEDIVQAE